MHSCTHPSTHHPSIHPLIHPSTHSATHFVLIKGHQGPSLRSQQAGFAVLDLAFIVRLTLCRSLHFAVPQFLQLYNGNDGSTCFIGPFARLETHSCWSAQHADSVLRISCYFFALQFTHLFSFSIHPVPLFIYL